MDVHLIDGTYELFRAYHGAPSLTSPSGQEVGAARGFARSLLALLREDGVSHAACAFDHTVESFRNDLFDGYKTGDGIEPELFAQFPLVEEAAFALGVVVWPMVEFEADDALASGATRYRDDPRVDRVVICSPDKDLTQCVVGSRVVCLDRLRRRVIDEAAVHEKFGVGPGQIPDYLALVGDTADGIPGVPRWGARSTATLLARYGSIDAIPADPTAWDVKVRGAAGLALNLEAQREAASLYRRLAQLRRDVPLDETLDDLEWRGARRIELESFCEKTGETRLLERVSRWR